MEEVEAEVVGKSSGYMRQNSDSNICIIAVDTDAHGIKSSELRQILENWPVGKAMPKFLYTVPVRNLLTVSFPKSDIMCLSSAATLQG